MKSTHEIEYKRCAAESDWVGAETALLLYIRESESEIALSGAKVLLDDVRCRLPKPNPLSKLMFWRTNP